MYCKNCCKVVEANATVCLGCGYKVGDGNNYCSNCGEPMEEGETVCLVCGRPYNFTVKQEKRSKEKPVKEKKVKENSKLTHKIAEFSTDVSDSTGGRKSNVKLALSKFNGLRINPGEEVSFNNITAPHTLDNGYKIATIIVNGRFVDGVGGGICQASTTLYNALLQTGVEILEVNKHTLPVRYVPLALDAMVSVGISDLKFKNTTDYPLFIKTSSNESSVKVEIFSHEIEDNISYKTRSETIKELEALGDIIQKDEKGEYQEGFGYVGGVS